MKTTVPSVLLLVGLPMLSLSLSVPVSLSLSADSSPLNLPVFCSSILLPPIAHRTICQIVDGTLKLPENRPIPDDLILLWRP